ncbi:MAG TPA: M91 family zinc metallopeptidase [Pyrinomonadaceae bacterium]|jgi:hypothetical protein
MGLAEIGAQIANQLNETLQAGVERAREAVSNFTRPSVSTEPQDANAMQLVSDRAVTSSRNEQTSAPNVVNGQSELDARVQLARTGAQVNAAGGGGGGSSAAPGTSETILVSTKEVTIKRTSTPAADPTEPPIERIVVDAGAGDDRIQVTRDPKTGATVINVNGERHDINLSTYIDPADGYEKAQVEVDGVPQQLGRNDPYLLTIRAGDGNDTIDVGRDVQINFTLEGGAGHDRIQGGAGHDRIEAGDGDDTVDGGAGRDYINGSRGNDKLYGGAGHDTVYGGDGDDYMQGNAGEDYLEGGRGRDHLLGGAGNDVLSGGLDDDTLEGGRGDDKLYAGAGTDKLYGSVIGNRHPERATGTDTIYSQTGDEVADDAGTTVVNVELVGQPGSRGVRVEGSPEFVERVEQDIEFLRSSPTGRQMLTEFDKAYDSTRDAKSDWWLIGRFFNDGNSVTIRELREEDNGFAAPTDYPKTSLDPKTGRAGAGSDVVISYNPQLNQFPFRDPNNPADAWRDLDPVVVLYHEMAHAYDDVRGVMQPYAPYQAKNPVDNDPRDIGMQNRERQAVGLENDGIPFDFDGDPKTPKTTANPHALTENGLRDELGRPRRPRYNIAP